MPSPLTIPGVQVRTEFEPAPVLPGATGILGVVGVADRGPVEPTPIGSFAEYLETFGPASRYSMPEVRTALANGIFRVVVARIEPGRGQKAFLDLRDDDGEIVARLEARAEGTWAHRLAVRVTQVKTASAQGTTPAVKYVNLEVLLDGESIETLANLVMDEASPNYFFAQVNARSRVLVAIDPRFEKGLPVTTARTALAPADPRAAGGTLRSGGADVIRLEAKRAGAPGNQIAVRVRDGRATLNLNGPGDAPSLLVRARTAGSDGAAIRVSVTAAGPGAVNLTIQAGAAAPRTLGPFEAVDAIAAGLANDPDVTVTARGTVLPAVLPSTRLGRTVTVERFAEGRDTTTYPDLQQLAEIAAIDDTLVRFVAVAGATALPDANEGLPLTGGRGRGPALAPAGDGGDEPLLELVPAPAAPTSLAVAITRGISTLDGATPVVKLEIFADDQLVETLDNLTMDPDDPNYLPAVLAASGFLRAVDLFVRSRTTSFPRELLRSVPLGGGASPTPDDYQGALDRLEGAEEVDLVIASAANQLTDAQIRTVHQAVVAHCTKMADVARNRIGIGSVTAAESRRVNDILDHANDVRSDHFILAAPARMEAAVAGLLGRQDYFQSPTFKTIASPSAPVGQYSDAQLEDLIRGDVLVVNERRRLGIIVVKGVLTSGRQVNVQRTANKAVRDVKAIADKYIGLLNNDGTRNALRQQIFALLLQMERDGALVPAVDGSSPAFTVDVYSTQADFANGIVRIDIAVRPVRAIDYIYATILVRN